MLIPYERVRIFVPGHLYLEPPSPTHSSELVEIEGRLSEAMKNVGLKPSGEVKK